MSRVHEDNDFGETFGKSSLCFSSSLTFDPDYVEPPPPTQSTIDTTGAGTTPIELTPPPPHSPPTSKPATPLQNNGDESGTDDGSRANGGVEKRKGDSDLRISPSLGERGREGRKGGRNKGNNNNKKKKPPVKDNGKSEKEKEYKV